MQRFPKSYLEFVTTSVCGDRVWGIPWQHCSNRGLQRLSPLPGNGAPAWKDQEAHSPHCLPDAKNHSICSKTGNALIPKLSILDPESPWRSLNGQGGGKQLCDHQDHAAIEWHRGLLGLTIAWSQLPRGMGSPTPASAAPPCCIQHSASFQHWESPQRSL